MIAPINQCPPILDENVAPALSANRKVRRAQRNRVSGCRSATAYVVAPSAEPIPRTAPRQTKRFAQATNLPVCDATNQVVCAGIFIQRPASSPDEAVTPNRRHPIRTCVPPAWWLLQGVQTRSHPELGRQPPSRQWYYVSRPGRVGRCQASKTQTGSTASIPSSPFLPRQAAPAPRTQHPARGGAAR